MTAILTVVAFLAAGAAIATLVKGMAGVMSRGLLAALLVMGAVAASAQTRNQAAPAGAAGVAARLQSQGYADIHNLRRMPDGKWVGEAIRNGHPVTVTSDPAGITISR